MSILKRYQRIIDRKLLHLKFRLGKSKIISDENRSMVFIISAGRSGSTLLRKRLMEKFYIHIPPESAAIIPSAYRHFVENGSKMGDERFIYQLVRQINNEEFKYWQIDTRELEERVYRSIDNGNLTLDKTIYEIYDYHRQLYNPSAKMIGDKTPYLVFYLKEIRDIFSKAKFIFLIREPGAVISSRIRSFGESMEVATDRWLWAVTEMVKFEANDHSSMFLKYEDLIQNGMIGQIGDWAGLEARPNEIVLDDEVLGDTVLSHHQGIKMKIDSDRNRHLRDALTSEIRNFIDKKTARMRGYLGYD